MAFPASLSRSRNHPHSHFRPFEAMSVPPALAIRAYCVPLMFAPAISSPMNTVRLGPAVVAEACLRVPCGATASPSTEMEAPFTSTVLMPGPRIMPPARSTFTLTAPRPSMNTFGLPVCACPHEAQHALRTGDFMLSASGFVERTNRLECLECLECMLRWLESVKPAMGHRSSVERSTRVRPPNSCTPQPKILKDFTKM